MARFKAPAIHFKPGDKVWADEGFTKAAAVIISHSSYGGGYYAAYDPPRDSCRSFWTCDNYLKPRE